jgi:hypothetical protein
VKKMLSPEEIIEKRIDYIEKAAFQILDKIYKIEEREIQRWSSRLKRQFKNTIFKDIPLDSIKSEIRYYVEIFRRMAQRK